MYARLVADVAQLVEHLICNQVVGGSTPSVGTILGSSVGTPTGMSAVEQRRSSCRARRICNAKVGGSTPSLGTKFTVILM